jgi:hypothetical protein
VRVVLDSNVVSSGVFFGGVPGEILAAWSRGRFDVVVSVAILAEYRRAGEALASGKPRLVEVWRPVMAWIARHADLVVADVTLVGRSTGDRPWVGWPPAAIVPRLTPPPAVEVAAGRTLRELGWRRPAEGERG